MKRSIIKKDINMTSGNIWQHLLMFAIPLLIGNVFQIMYNTVDSIVVGNFVGKQALAAVGGSGPIINTLIGTFNGLSSGATVIISQYYGAHDDENVSDAVHTTIYLTLVLSVAFTFLGILGSSSMLRLMAVPDDVIPEAETYLRIYFGGVSGLLFYNMGAGILRAVGDSRRPTIFLVISAVTNIVLDLVFVLVFSWGTAGVAYATIISQFLSALLVLITLMRAEGAFKLILRNVKCTWNTLVKIVNIGLPTSIQQGVTSFSNVFIQSYINIFGSAAMAGWSSYTKIDQLVLLPIQAAAFSSTTFVGQNWGALQYDRAKKGVRTAMKISLLMTSGLILVIMIFSRHLIYMFNQDPGVLEYGALMVRYLSPFYLLCCVNQIYTGALRGAGDSRFPMIIMLSSFVAFRQVYMAIVSKLMPGNIIPIIFGYPAGWFLASVALFIYYKFGNWERKYRIPICGTDGKDFETKSV